MLQGRKMRPPSTRSSVCAFLTSILGLIFATGPTLATTTLTRSSITRSISSSPPPQSTKSSTVELNGSAGANPSGILLPFFLPDSEPLSLVASVVAVSKTTIIVTKTIIPTNSNSKSSGQASQTKIPPTTTTTTTRTTSLVTNTITGTSDPSEITLQIDCPTGSSPENDACRSASIYPAQVTQRLLAAGSEWKGVTTYLVGDDSTTSWTCWQGMTMKEPELGGDNYGMVPYAQCASTVIKSGGSSIRMGTTTYDECYLYRHMVPLVVTAGQENLPFGAEWERQIGAGAGGGEDVKGMNAGWASKMSRLGCGLDGTRTMWAGSVKTSIPVVTGAAVVGGKTTTSGANAQREKILWKGGMVFAGIWWLLVGFATA